jgi:hypothetical protein
MRRIATRDRPSAGTAAVARGALTRLSASEIRRRSCPRTCSPGGRVARRRTLASRRATAARARARALRAAASAACLRRAAAARRRRAAAAPARRAAAVRDRDALRPPRAVGEPWRRAGAAARRGLFLAGRAPVAGRGRRSAPWGRPDDRGCRLTVRGAAGPPREGCELAAGGGLPAAGGGGAGAWLLTPGCVAAAVGVVVSGGVVVAGGVVVSGAVVTGGVVTGGVVTGGGSSLPSGGFGPLPPWAKLAGAANARARMSTDVATPMLRRREGPRRWFRRIDRGICNDKTRRRSQRWRRRREKRRARSVSDTARAKTAQQADSCRPTWQVQRRQLARWSVFGGRYGLVQSGAGEPPGGAVTGSGYVTLRN